MKKPNFEKHFTDRHYPYMDLGRLNDNTKAFRELKYYRKPKPYTTNDAINYPTKIETVRLLDSPIDGTPQLIKKILTKHGLPYDSDNRVEMLWCYQAHMHDDSVTYNDSLFFNIVVHTNKQYPHIFSIQNFHTDQTACFELKMGQVFIFDPNFMHSVMSVSPKVEELILLQYIMQFKSTKQKNDFMASILVWAIK